MQIHPAVFSHPRKRRSNADAFPAKGSTDGPAPRVPVASNSRSAEGRVLVGTPVEEPNAEMGSDKSISPSVSRERRNFHGDQIYPISGPWHAARTDGG